MTSKNLFFNLIRENLKRRIWPIALSMVVFFFSLPVAISMGLSNYLDRYKGYNLSIIETDVMKLMENVLGKQCVFLVVITCIMAVIFAVQGFGYLFSKSKVDFYHSMPVRREKLFITTFLNGILVYLIPYCINLLLSYLISAFYGVLSTNIVLAGINSMLVNLIFYFFLYSTIVLVVMLTGNLVVSLLGSAVFLFLGPLYYTILQQYTITYFSTYHYKSGIGGEVIGQRLSPLFTYFYVLFGRKNEYDFIPSVMGALAVGVVFVIIAVILYRKRPSEMAGKSMVFSSSKPIIKILLMIPLVLGSGLFFKLSSSNNSDGWLIFGIIVGILLSHCLIEIIYEFDLKAVKYNLKFIGIPTVIAVIIICFYRFDLMSYDSYLPKKENLKSVSIELPEYIGDYMEENSTKELGYTSNGNDTFHYSYNNEYFERNTKNQLVYYHKEEYIFRHVKFTDMEKVYPLLEASVKSNTIYKHSGGNFVMPVKYVLKNGKEVYRYNYINIEKYEEMINDLINTREYREGSNLIYNYSIEELSEMQIEFRCNEKGSIEFRWNEIGSNESNEEFKTPYISKEQKKELLEVYKEELSSIKLNYLTRDNPVGEIGILVEGDTDTGKEIGTIYNYVYPEFVKTIELMNRYIKKQP